jgi:virginiamycin A acetyltransferase
MARIVSENHPDFVRISFSSQQQSCRVFKDVFYKFLKSKPLPFTRDNEDFARYEIGEWTYGYPKIMWLGEKATLKIGKFCSIASGVTIMLGGNHRIDCATSYPLELAFSDAKQNPGLPFTKGDVEIGNDVWIGAEAFILSGVKIGSGSVIGARSVVSKDIAPYSIAIGNPARVVRLRFSENIIQDLLRIAWWDWPVSRIKEAMPLLLDTQIDKFIAAYK